MILNFDPGDIDQFKSTIRAIPGFPTGEELPIRDMVFDSGAIWRLPDLFLQTGIKQGQTLHVVMDRTNMQREGRDLKELILQILADAGWPAQVIWLEPDQTGQVHTNIAHIDFVKSHLQSDSVVLSIGSGTDRHCQACLSCLAAGA